MNSLAINGMLVKREEVRFTPSGLQVFEGLLHHDSEVREAAGTRKLDFTCQVTAFGETAAKLQQLELPAAVSVQGYISPRSCRSQRLLVYITDFS